MQWGQPPFPNQSPLGLQRSSTPAHRCCWPPSALPAGLQGPSPGGELRCPSCTTCTEPSAGSWHCLAPVTGQRRAVPASSCWFYTRGLHPQRAFPGSGHLWDGCSACLLLPASSGRGLVSPGSTELAVTRPQTPAGGPGQGLGQVSSPQGRIRPAGAAETAPEAPLRGRQKCFQATPQAWRMEEHEKQPGTWSKPGPAGALGQGAVRLQGGTGRGEATSGWGL